MEKKSNWKNLYYIISRNENESLIIILIKNYINFNITWKNYFYFGDVENEYIL